jgi:hypothetical protein
LGTRARRARGGPTDRPEVGQALTGRSRPIRFRRRSTTARFARPLTASSVVGERVSIPNAQRTVSSIGVGPTLRRGRKPVAHTCSWRGAGLQTPVPVVTAFVWTRVHGGPCLFVQHLPCFLSRNLKLGTGAV